MGEVSDALRRAAAERDRSPVPLVAASAGAPAACRILRSKDGAWRARAVLVDTPGRQVDQFRHFALRTRRSLQANHAKTVLIASALQGEGKTLVACNLALALASMAGESRVALVDLDLHRPSVATSLGIPPGSGIEQVLRGEIDPREARIRTDIPALDVFPVSRRVKNAHEVLAHSSLRRLLLELSSQYATVVCDSPPSLLVPDVELIAPYVDACVLVARAGTTRRQPFREMVAMLPAGKVIGTFLNCASPPRHARNYTEYAQDAGSENSSPANAVAADDPPRDATGSADA